MKYLNHLFLLLALFFCGIAYAQTTVDADFGVHYQVSPCDSGVFATGIDSSIVSPSNAQVFYVWEIFSGQNGTETYYGQFPTFYLSTGVTYQITMSVYEDPNYQVLLDSHTEGFFINPQASLFADFTYNYENSTCNGDSIIFTDATSGSTPVSWAWYIDGQPVSNLQNPYLFLSAGTHTVMLEVYNANNCYSSSSYTISTQGQGNNIVATFTYNTINSSCTSNTVEFFGAATGGQGPYTYNWSFGETGQNVTGQLSPFSEWVTLSVTDANGCTGIYEDIVIDSTNSLSVYAETSNATCVNDCNHIIEIEAYGGATPYIYSIDQGATFQSSHIFENLCAGTYVVMAQDANGCDAVYTIQIDSIAAIDLQFYTYTPSCNGQGQDTTSFSFIEAYIANGQQNVSYEWSNGETGNYIDNLTAGTYTVIATDANGCTATGSVVIPEIDECYTISGNVYIDYNGNCMIDSGDIGLPSYWVDLVDDSGNFLGFYDFTDVNGTYQISVPAGEYFFDLGSYNYNNYSQNCPADGFSISVDANNPNGIVDFFMNPPAPIQDLSISMYNISTPTPGFPLWTSVYYCNDGTIPMSGNVSVEHDPNLIWINQGNTSSGGYIYTAPSPDNYDAPSNTLTFNFSNLMPGQCNFINIDYETSTSAGLLPGDPIANQATVNPIVGDVTPSNNTTYVNDYVTSSWDPNDKAVYPNGNMTIDDKDHSYHIRFQNEGNANAHVVVVRDDLDDNLDLQSLRNVSASHNFIMTIENEDELVFTFNNIQLPPKDVDEIGSQGYIDFTISQEANLPIGTVIENTAAIYFDFNEAIITNTVSNEIVEKTVGIDEQEIRNAIALYPNPSSGVFKITSELMIKSIKVYDILGNIIFEGKNIDNTHAILNLGETSEGIYFVQFATEKGTATKKILVQQ